MPYFDTLRTLREKAGIRLSVLAKASGLDRGTISRVEKHGNSTPTTLNAIINALNTIHYNKSGSILSYEELVTEKSRYGGR